MVENMVEFRCWLLGILLRIFLVMFSVSRCWRWRNFGWRCDWDVRKHLFGLNFDQTVVLLKKAMYIRWQWTKRPVHIHSWKQAVAEFEIFPALHFQIVLLSVQTAFQSLLYSFTCWGCIVELQDKPLLQFPDEYRASAFYQGLPFTSQLMLLPTYAAWWQSICARITCPGSLHGIESAITWALVKCVTDILLYLTLTWDNSDYGKRPLLMSHFALQIACHI